MSGHLMDCIEDAYEAGLDIRRVCRGCGAVTRAHLEDGYCHKCNGDEPSIGDEIRRDMERRREATRRAEERANRRRGL